MQRNKLSIKYWVFYHVGILLFSGAFSILMKYHQTGNGLHPTVIVPFVTISLMSISIGYLAMFLVRKTATLSHQQLTRRVVPALILFYIGSTLIANIVISFGVFAWYLHIGRDLSDFWSHLFKNELSMANLRLLGWLMFFSIAFFYVLWRKSAKREHQLIEESLKYRYNTLKLQVKPHFLFNSFNTLSELIHLDTKQADTYLHKLSGIYRYVLENEENDLISLEEELNFVRQYFDLQKERDNGKISLTTDVQDAAAYKVIPVSIQLLVENALKHNSISIENPLRIEIYKCNETIVVANNLQRKNVYEDSIQIGLSNLKEQIKLIMNKEMSILEENNKFIVELPITPK